MLEQIAVKNDVEEIIGHTGNDPVTMLSVKLEWRDEEGLWYQTFCFAGDDWQSWSVISTCLSYDTLLKYFGLFDYKNKLNFGEIAHSSPAQLKKLQIEKYPRLGQIEIFPLASNDYLEKSIKCEFTRCEKRFCPACKKDFETSWMGYASTYGSNSIIMPHIIQLCPHCGLQHEAVI